MGDGTPQNKGKEKVPFLSEVIYVLSPKVKVTGRDRFMVRKSEHVLDTGVWQQVVPTLAGLGIP